MSERTLSIAGVTVPRFLYGTAWKEEQTRRLTELALRQGFRGIDTANQRFAAVSVCNLKAVDTSGLAEGDSDVHPIVIYERGCFADQFEIPARLQYPFGPGE